MLSVLIVRYRCLPDLLFKPLKMRNYIYFFALIFVLFNSCKDEDGSKGFPGVTTSSILDITEDGVVVFADIQENGVFEILDHGFVYNMEENAGKEEDYNRISLGSFSGNNSFSATIERNLRAGNHYVVKAFVKTKDRMVYGNPITFVSKGSKSPVLEKFFPETAYLGDTVTISGRYFSDKNTDNAIYFGKTQTYPIFSTDKLLKVIVPILSESTVQMKILVAGKTAISNNKFSLGMPVVYRYIPERVMPLEIIEIKGKGLSLVSKVTVDGIIHSLTQATDSTAKLVLSNMVKKGKKTLQLTQLDRLVSIDKQFEIVFPEILKVSPLTAWLDTILYIKGTHLDKLTNLSINYEPMTLLSSSDSLLKMKISRVFRSGSFRSKFLNNDILSNQEVKFNPPVITSISPSTAKYGDVVHVYGERFFSDLSFSGWTCTYLNKNEVTLTVPWSIPAGFFTFKLSNNEEYPIVSVGLTIPAMEITEISPYEVQRGTEVTIKVKNLPTSSELVNKVICLLDNNTSLTIKEVKDGTIKAIIPIYINCSQNPTLTLNVGSQSKSLTNAIHINDKWEKISGGSNLSGLFCYSNETRTAYNYDLAGPSLKTFDPQLGSWTNITKSPYAGFSNPVTSFQLGSDLYFVGTKDGILIVDKYSTTNQSWSKLSKYPEKVGSDVFAFVINGTAYVGTSDQLFEYNPKNDTWLAKGNPKIDTGSSNRLLAFSINNKGYIMSQYQQFDINSPFAYFYEFDPKNNTWLKVGNFNWGAYDGGWGTEYNKKMYLCTNSYTAYWNQDDNFLEFDPLTYQFRKLLAPPEYYYPQTYSFISGDYFYVVSASSGDNYFSWMYRIRLKDLTSL